jgi:hypothetical protein
MIDLDVRPRARFGRPPLALTWRPSCRRLACLSTPHCREGVRANTCSSSLHARAKLARCNRERSETRRSRIRDLARAKGGSRARLDQVEEPRGASSRFHQHSMGRRHESSFLSRREQGIGKAQPDHWRFCRLPASAASAARQTHYGVARIVDDPAAQPLAQPDAIDRPAVGARPPLTRY